MLANPGQDVLIYDVESWMVWKEVWDTFERDGVPKTDNLNDMQRYSLFDIWKRKRKEKKRLRLSVDLMRSQVIYQAAH